MKNGFVVINADILDFNYAGKCDYHVRTLGGACSHLFYENMALAQNHFVI